MSDNFRIETRSGAPLQASGWTVTPVTRVLIIRFPFLHGGLIWNRPIELRVQASGEPEQKLYLPDVTRQIQVTPARRQLVVFIFNFAGISPKERQSWLMRLFRLPR